MSAVIFEPLTHGVLVQSSIRRKVEQVFLPLWAARALRHAGADKKRSRSRGGRHVEFIESFLILG